MGVVLWVVVLFMVFLHEEGDPGPSHERTGSKKANSRSVGRFGKEGGVHALRVGGLPDRPGPKCRAVCRCS